VEITLSEAERAELVRRTELPHRRSAEKARIILACADGMSNMSVARVVGVQAKRVGKWRRAFAAERMAGLEDAGWIGRTEADLVLDDAERRQLQQWARQAKTAQVLALRAKIVLRCAEGGTNQQAAADLGRCGRRARSQQVTSMARTSRPSAARGSGTSASARRSRSASMRPRATAA
jgi:transposase